MRFIKSVPATLRNVSRRLYDHHFVTMVARLIPLGKKTLGMIWQTLKSILKRTVREPVALFTLLLALFSLSQIWFLIKADRTATETAKAAIENARAAVIGQRPFVSHKTIDLSPVRNPTGNRVNQWNVTVIWTNHGNTPTLRAQTYVHAISFPGPMPASYQFERDPTTPTTEVVETVIDPKSDRANTVLPVSVATMQDVIAGKQKLYVWGWAEYNDFVPNTPRHRTEFCVEIVVTGDANNPTGISALTVFQKRHNSAT